MQITTPTARGPRAPAPIGRRALLAPRSGAVVRRSAAPLPPRASSGRGGALAQDAAPPQWRNTEGGLLTKEEVASLALALPPPPPDPEFAGSAALPEACARAASLLRRGLSKGVEDLSQLEGAILLAEQVHLGALAASQGDGKGAGGGGGGRGGAGGTAGLQSDPGVKAVRVWQPVFASAGGFPRLLYIPVPEYFDLSASGALRPTNNPGTGRAALTGSVDVVTEMGPVTTHFLGPCRWAEDGRTFEYWVESLRVEIPALRAKFTLPFRLHNALTLFHYDAGSGLACARSRLGGTMLLAANPSAAAKYIEA